jgi:hypothetical protein
MKLIKLYRDLTIMKVGNGLNICFWLNSWIENKTLSIQYPALFYMFKMHVTVAECFTKNGWQLRFRHTTSQRADNELLALMSRIENISLNEEADTRFMRFGPDKKFC